MKNSDLREGYFEMKSPKLETITREEFDKRLEESNEQKRQELLQQAEEQARVEQLLTRYEHALDEIEAELDADENAATYPTLLRERLQELANKTVEVAASL